MSTPGTGNTDGERRANADGGRATGAPNDPTELMDTGRSGAGASSVGGPGASSQVGSNDDGSGYVPGAYSSDDDATAEYVPGMYSDDSGTTPRHATTREQPAPISASRDGSRGLGDATTQAHTQVVPVTAAKGRGGRRDEDAGRGRDRHVAGSGLPGPEDRKLLHQREKQHFGGMKFGSAFFGWLTATGMFVLFSALVGALAALFGVGDNLSTADLAGNPGEARSMGITAAVVLGVVLLLSYYAGGYVAGRMARFSGVKQGVAVWLWAVIVAVLLTVVGLIIGNQANVTERFQGLGVPAAQDLTGPGLIGLLVVAAIALVGAILGGLAGMRYHRRIDRADFDALEDAG